MALALLTSSLMGAISLVITIALGFAVDSRADVNQHFLFALFTTIVFTMAVFIIGAGVDTRVVPVWIHTALGALALMTFVYALFREIQYMSRNNILLDEIAGLVGSAPEAE